MGEILHSVELGWGDNKDRFLKNPPWQPKREIANMVERQGILVPRRFDSLVEAMVAVEEGKQIIVRSEHPLEYGGVAGLLRSYTIDSGRLQTAKESKGAYPELEHLLVGSKKDQFAFEASLVQLSLPKIQEYCQLLNLNPSDFCQEISYSYWEKIPGFNRSIVADSAVPNRYHIFTTAIAKAATFHNYVVVDQGKILVNFPNQITGELHNGLPDVLKFYETVRNLPGFNPEHCPLVEFQSNEDRNYFLQYHRTRDAAPVSWILDRAKEEGEIKAVFVRGATPPEGIVVDVTLYQRGMRSGILPEGEEGSYCPKPDPIFSEIMSRRQLVNFVAQDLWGLAADSINVHLPKSTLFNPAISVFIDPDGNFPAEFEVVRMQEDIKPPHFKIRVVSDGRTAYIKVVSAILPK